MFIRIQGKDDAVKIDRVHIWEENGHIIMGECGKSIFQLGHYNTYTQAQDIFLDILNKISEGANYFAMPLR